MEKLYKQMEQLVDALNLTQQPSTSNFQKAEDMLTKARQEKDYFTCLLQVIAKDDLPQNIKLAAACCLSKDLKTFLSSLNVSCSGDLIEQVLGNFKQLIFQILSQNVYNTPICNKLEESLKSVVHTIYPFHWENLGTDLLGVLKETNNFQIIYSALKGVFYMLSKYKNSIGDKREPLKFLSKQTLPYVENMCIKLLNQLQGASDLSNQVHEIVIRILNTILKCFHSVNYLRIEKDYFTPENSKIWLFCFIQSSWSPIKCN